MLFTNCFTPPLVLLALIQLLEVPVLAETAVISVPDAPSVKMFDPILSTPEVNVSVLVKVQFSCTVTPPAPFIVSEVSVLLVNNEVGKVMAPALVNAITSEASLAVITPEVNVGDVELPKVRVLPLSFSVPLVMVKAPLMVVAAANCHVAAFAPV